AQRGELLRDRRRREVVHLGDGAHRAESRQRHQQFETPHIHTGDCSRIANCMSTIIAWTETFPAVFNTEVTTNQARLGSAMALGSMMCVQLGLAVSVMLIGRIGAEGVAWLRLFWAGVVLLLIVRPRRSAFTPRSFAVTVVLGVVTAMITVLFM